MLNGTWSTDNISFVLPNDVLKAIKATPIRRSARRDDQCYWVSSANRDFETKSAYLLAINEDLSIQDVNGKWLWKLCTLPKIKYFLWKCYHHSLPVNAILEHRGFEGLGGYSSCLDPNETIAHVLRDCPEAQRFWRQASRPSHLQQSFLVTSSLATELWALREGLVLCVEMQAQAVVVELDAIAAVSLISNNACTNGDFSILVDDCRDMLLQLP
nr:hypothetical protein CFP56_41155 [Quercus suber]